MPLLKTKFLEAHGALDFLQAIRLRFYKFRRRILYPKSRDRFLFTLRFGWKRVLVYHTQRVSFKIATASWNAKQHFYPSFQDGYEAPVVSLLEERLKPDSCFLDIGANVGFFSLLASKLCTEGSVHAFDIDPELIAELMNNLRLNRLENVRLTCAAVWDTDGYILTFNPVKANKTMNTVCQPGSSARTSIPSLRIDNYCRQLGVHPDIAKIDVEGAEANVLRGMVKTLEELSVLLLEIHPESLPIFGSSTQEILELLGAHSFRISLIQNHRSPVGPQLKIVEVEDACTLTENCMLFCEKALRINA